MRLLFTISFLCLFTVACSNDTKKKSNDGINRQQTADPSAPLHKQMEGSWILTKKVYGDSSNQIEQNVGQMEMSFSILDTSNDPIRGKVQVVNLSTGGASATYDFELSGNIYTFILNGGGREAHTVSINGANLILSHTSGLQRDYLTRK